MTVFLAASKKVIPYVIEINQDGQVFDLNESLKTAPSDIKDKLAITNIADFVRYIYAVSPDGNINNLYQSKAFALSKGSASKFIQDYFAIHDAKEIAAKYIVSVAINYILPESQNTIKVSWTEFKRDVQSNSLISKQKYIGQFSYYWDTRSYNEVISKFNPLGFYINYIVTNKDYA
jgi:type IV secretory pathway TrbF-like protein